MVKACCVPGCTSGIKVPSHKFPKDAARCFKWIESLKLYDLKKYCANDLQKYKVCHKHFLEKDYSCSLHNRFLLKTAIPVISLENNIDTDTDDNNRQHEQSQQESENAEQSNHTVQHSYIENNLLYRIINIEEKMQEYNNRLTQHQDLLMQNNLNQLALQNQILEQEKQYLQKESENEVQIHQDNTIRKNKEHTSILRNSIQRRPNLQNITCVANLSSSAKLLYDTIIKLRRKNKRLKHLIQQSKYKRNKRAISLVHTNQTAPVREKFINMILKNHDVPSQIFNIEVFSK